MTDYPPEVAALLARGAEVVWYPDGYGGAVIIGIAWPLGWDSPRFRNAATGRGSLVLADGQCVPRPRDAGPAVLPRPGPAVAPIAAQAPQCSLINPAHSDRSR